MGIITGKTVSVMTLRNNTTLKSSSVYITHNAKIGHYVMDYVEANMKLDKFSKRNGTLRIMLA